MPPIAVSLDHAEPAVGIVGLAGEHDAYSADRLANELGLLLESDADVAVDLSVGTFTLVFIGAGSILTFGKLFAGAFAAGSGSQVAGLGLVAVALAHGLAIGVMVSAVGHISGGHFNPAITLGFLVTRRLAPILALVYWFCQFAAAAAAALLLRWLFQSPIRASTHLGTPGLGSGVSIW